MTRFQKLDAAGLICRAESRITVIGTVSAERGEEPRTDLAGEGVRCRKLVTPPARTRESHRRDGRDVGYDPRRTPKEAPPPDVPGGAA
jgi:hypothetical protein